MKRALLMLALSGCISDSDLENATANYCAFSAGQQCAKTDECCVGFACAAGVCQRLFPRQCLFPPDAGHVQPLGEGCGCTDDCATGTCSASRCQ